MELILYKKILMNNKRNPFMVKKLILIYIIQNKKYIMYYENNQIHCILNNIIYQTKQEQNYFKDFKKFHK